MAERDANGRFTKEYSGGPGRPKKAREEKYYEITQASCTFASWGRIVKKAVQQAERGDAVARKFLADYLIGPPPKELRITGGEGGPLVIEHVNDWRASGGD